jgi:hypothetical protein
MVVAQRGIDHVERTIAALESVLHERQQHTVQLVPAVEERANVTVLAERGAGNSYAVCLHGTNPRVARAGTIRPLSPGVRERTPTAGLTKRATLSNVVVRQDSL